MRICVFCGASPGQRPVYREATRAFGELLVREGIELVYGGGAVGLMGVLADAVLESGGHVIGVIPQSLATREIAHQDISDLRVVGSMHERKALMAELSDAFVALPGGIGTLEELFEVWTWAQLGIHRKPCALYDVNGFYEGLGSFMDHVVAEGFLRRHHRSALIVERDPHELLRKLDEYQAPLVPKWIEPDET
jgi:uncharacterized protein (TIGR00730 family)